MTKKKINSEKKEIKNNEHNTEHINKKTKKYKKMIEGYKKRNRLVMVVISCIVFVCLFVLACNKTFLNTNYTKQIGNSKISIDLPRFTYYLGSNENEIVFKTLRKSANTRKFFKDFLESDRFDIYYCGDSETPYYYSREGKYFIYNIEVEKKFAIKTVTVNYTTVEYDEFCKTVSDSK